MCKTAFQNKHDDTQEHILTCKSLNGLTDRTYTEIQFMYGTNEEQRNISKILHSYEKTRKAY